MSELTTEDVRRIVADECAKLDRSFSQKLNAAVAPAIERTDGHHRTLYGIEGRNGMVGDVAILKDAERRRSDGEKSLKGWIASGVVGVLVSIGVSIWNLLTMGSKP